MKITPMRQKMDALKLATSDPTIDQLERLLNGSKGTGQTNLAVFLAEKKNIPVVVDSEKTISELEQFHPDVKFLVYDKVIPGNLVTIDVCVIWLLLRKAQECRKLGQALVNWMEHKQRDW